MQSKEYTQEYTEKVITEIQPELITEKKIEELEKFQYRVSQVV